MATFFVQDIFNIFGIGPVVVGQVKSGSLRQGMKASIGGKEITINRMEKNHQMLSEAKEGDSIGITLTNADAVLLKQMVGKAIEFA